MKDFSLWIASGFAGVVYFVGKVYFSETVKGVVKPYVVSPGTLRRYLINIAYYFLRFGPPIFLILFSMLTPSEVDKAFVFIMCSATAWLGFTYCDHRLMEEDVKRKHEAKP